MVDICQKTAQSKGSLTLYSNVQNLTTGDVWFFSDRQYETPIKTNISNMLSKGRQSYSFDDLKALIEYREAYNRAEPKKIEVPQATIERYTGTYRHPFGLLINVELHDEGIELSAEGIPTSVAFPQSANTFFLPDEDTVLIFKASERGTQMRMSSIENGNR